MKLIGITGKARSGKDTIAKHLFHQHAFTRIAFGDPVKLTAQQAFGLSEAQTWDDEYKEVVIPYWGMSPREIFQKVGTDAMRNTFGANVWIKRWSLSYLLLKDTDHIVVPDVRFDNEAELIRNLGGIIVDVQRGTGLTGSTGDHASEKGLSSLPDYVINNSGTLDELYAQVDYLVEVGS